MSFRNINVITSIHCTLFMIHERIFLNDEKHKNAQYSTCHYIKKYQFPSLKHVEIFIMLQLLLSYQVFIYLENEMYFYLRCQKKWNIFIVDKERYVLFKEIKLLKKKICLKDLPKKRCFLVNAILFFEHFVKIWKIFRIWIEEFFNVVNVIQPY